MSGISNLLRPGLTLTAMKLAAQSPGGVDELRAMRRELMQKRDRLQKEHERMFRDMDEVISNLGIAVGEVEA